MLNEGLAALDRYIGAEPEPEPAEGAPEGGTPEPEQDRPRDEQGRFTAQPDTETELEAGEQEQPEAQPQTEPLDERFATYLTRIGVDPAHLEGLDPSVRKALDIGFEADRTIGRQGQEYGERLKALEEALSQRNEQQQTQPGNRYDTDEVLGYFAEHPTAIMPTITDAYQRNDRSLVYLALRALDDVDPGTAGQLRNEIAKRDAMAEIAPRLERNEQAEFRSSLADTWAQVRVKHADLDKYTDQILQIVEQDPDAVRGLATGNPEKAFKDLENLYKIVSFDAQQQNRQLVKDAEQQTAEQAALEAKAAKHDAFVGTGTQRVETESSEPVDPLLAAYDKAFANSRYARQ